MTSTPTPTARPKEGEANPFARLTRPLGLRRWLPIILLVQTYQRGWLLKDLIAGLALTAVLVPVGMGYAEASGLPAIYGLSDGHPNWVTSIVEAPITSIPIKTSQIDTHQVASSSAISGSYATCSGYS